MIPNLFSKEPIPDVIPEELSQKIREYSKTKDKEIFLKSAFDYVTKWRGNRFNLFFKFSRLFQRDPSKIISTEGYMHCTTMNFLLRIMAVKSGLFKDEDIELKLTNTWFLALHQYLRIKLSDEKYLNIDPWNYQFGIDFGKFGSGFDSTKINPIR